MDDVLNRLTVDCHYHDRVPGRQMRCNAYFVDLRGPPRPPDLPPGLAKLRVVGGGKADVGPTEGDRQRTVPRAPPEAANQQRESEDAMSITYYVALPFGRDDEGTLVAGEAKDFQSANGAERAARAMAEKNAGAIAFSRSGDPSVGEFEPAVILKRFGETPYEVE